MEPRIHDGDYCVFRFNPKGSRNGKIVLAQYRGPADPETGGSYTVKEYHSVKTTSSGDEWRHEKILLKPLNPDFEPIELFPETAEDFQIVAELIGIIK